MKIQMKKTLSVLLSIVMLASVFAGMTFTASAANTYQISTYAELSAFADAVNGGETDASAILTADIIAEGTDWTPIGDLDHLYVGTFDGDGHTITGLSTESSAGRDYVGLFGYVGAGGVVQNVGLVGGCIKGQDLVGAVAGENSGKIINCYNMGTVQSIDDGSFVGGVVGRNIEGTVRSCYNTGTVNGLKAYAGGVVGIISKGTVQNCYNTGDVSGAIVGGVAGFNTADIGGSAEISNCFNTGKISGTNMVGGVAGRNNADDFFGRVGTASVSNCYNMGAISVNGDYGSAGGVIGFNTSDPGSTASVISCYSAGTVTASGFDIDAGGVIGSNHYGAVQNCYYDSDVCAANNGLGTRLTTAQMTGEAALSGMPGFSSENWLVRSADEYYSYYPHLKGFAYDATAAAKDWPARKVKDGAMEISNYDELKAFAAAVNGGQTGLKAILKSDIAATDKEWTPIGNELKPYVGIFDGDGHTITGLSNEDVADAPRNAGLFGWLGKNAVVKNVQLTGVDLKATDYLGAVAGNAIGAEITNCRNTGEINCTASGVGGIIGSIYGAIVSNCCNTGDITSTANNAYVGGIAGFLCGDQSAAGITNCYNTGTVTGKGRYSNVGGIAGYANDRNCTVEIANCYNTGAVTATGTSSRAGGIAASSCVFDGGTVEIINCYSAGAVTADERVGGVVGLKYNSVVRNCWYDDNVCNLSSAVGSVADTDDVKGLHMCEMTGADALTQMPFSEPSAWLVKENSDICVFYPHLKGFDLDADGDQMDASAIDPADWPAKRNHSHSYGAPVWSWEKCHGKATAAFTCTGCGGETQTVTDNAPTFENGQFTAAVEFQNNPYTDTVSLGTGDLVEFGSYPQTLVPDGTLKDELDAMAENWTDSDWTSYKYYFNGVQDDFMQYADVTYNGNRYRAVRFDHYRPFYTTNASTDADNAWQDENNYSPDTVYWFEYEPIVWRILDADAGLMLTESIVDSQPFCNGFYYSGGEYYGDADHTHYASDWADSSLRAWLNGDFLNAAFDSGAQSHIKNTSLVTPSSNSSVYDAGPTTDKIFVLSKDDVLNTAYGFISGTDGVESANRTAFGTDYAKCQGLLVEDSPGDYFSGASWWRLRSPYLSYGAGDVGHDGHVDDNMLTDYTDDGVRPAVKINLQSAIAQSAVRIHHDCGEFIPEVPATCADDGAIAHYECSWCGAYFDVDRDPVADLTIPAADHTYGDTGDDRFTCTVCGHVDDNLKAAAEAADKAAFEEYKETVKELADLLARENDSDACIALIEAAKTAVDAVVYDESKTLDENEEALDEAAALTQLAADLAAQRAAEADDPREAFEAYRETLLTLAQALRKEGDSEAVTALIDEAVAALTGLTYDEAKPLAENEDALDQVMAYYVSAVRDLRHAERQAILNKQPCSLCGKHHTGSIVDNLIGIIHGIIWILRSFALIAA